MTRKRTDNDKKKPTGDYPAGYARPPISGQIRKGEVRNPYGKNGKPKDEIDGFDFAMSQPTRITLGGVAMTVPVESAIYAKHAQLALAGSERAFTTISRERSARYKKQRPDIAAPTAAELAQEAAEMEEKKALAAKLVALLNQAARSKKMEGETLRDAGDAPSA